MENEKQLLLDNKQEKGKRLDILTKVSPKRKDIREAFGKEIINKDLPLLIRNNFSKSLDKINSLDTKDIGFNELKQIITLYNNQEYLKIYYSLLSVYNKNFSTSAKELQILTIGYLSSVYKESLIDISDKPPNLLKTVSKFIGIINNFMSKEKNFSIIKVCSHSLSELLSNCMNNDSKSIYQLFIDPYVSNILHGDNNNIKDGSSLFLSDIITVLSENQSPILDELFYKIIFFISKCSHDSPYLIECLNTLIENVKFTLIAENLPIIIEKLLTLVDKTSNYQSKLNICKVFLNIALNLKCYQDKTFSTNFNKKYSERVINSLKICVQDRAHTVKVSGNEAINEWHDLDKNIEGNSEIKSGDRVNKLSLLRNMSKLNKAKGSTPQNIKDEIYSKGIRVLLRTAKLSPNRDLSSGKTQQKGYKSFSIEKKNSSTLKNFINQIKSQNKINNKKIEDFQIFFKEKENLNFKNEIFKEEEFNADNADQIEFLEKKSFEIPNSSDLLVKKQGKLQKSTKNQELENTISQRVEINEEKDDNENEDVIERNQDKFENNNVISDHKENNEKINSNFNSAESNNDSKLINEKSLNPVDEIINKSNSKSNLNLSHKNHKNDIFTLRNDLQEKLDYSQDISSNNKSISNKETLKGISKIGKIVKDDNVDKKSKISDSNSLLSEIPKNEEKSGKISKICENFAKNLKNLKKENNEHRELLNDSEILKHDEKEISNEIFLNSNSKNEHKKELSIEKKNKSNEISINNQENHYLNLDSNFKGRSKENSINNKNEDKIIYNKSNNSRSKGFVDNKQSNNLEESITNEKKNNQIDLKENNSISNSKFQLDLSVLKVLKTSFEKMSFEFDNKLKDYLSKLSSKIDNLEQKVKAIKKVRKLDLVQVKKTIEYKTGNSSNKLNELQIKDECRENLADKDVPTIWNESINLIKNNHFEEAYKLILSSEDDIYLLRLCNLTGSVLDKLSFFTSIKVLKRVCLISRSNQINFHTCKLIKHSYELNIFEHLNEEDQNEILETLYEFSLSSEKNLSTISSDLYNHIINSL